MMAALPIRSVAAAAVMMLAATAAPPPATAPSPPDTVSDKPPVRVPDKPMVLGISTHFDQGVSPDRLDLVAALGARTIRDDLSWGKGEPQPGRYAFDQGDSRYNRIACQRGIRT